MPATRARRVLPVIGVSVAVLGLSACQADSPFGEAQAAPTILVASPVYSAGNGAAQTQLASLLAHPYYLENNLWWRPLV